jgi:hypothetical protein
MLPASKVSSILSSRFCHARCTSVDEEKIHMYECTSIFTPKPLRGFPYELAATALLLVGDL